MTSSALKFKAFFLYFVFFSSLLYYCGHDYYLIIKCLGLSTALIIFISIFFSPLQLFIVQLLMGEKKKKKSDSCEGQLQIDVFKFKVVCYGRINTP